MTLLLAILLSLTSDSLFSNLKDLDFQTGFVETVTYKNSQTVDTFKGNLKRKGSKLVMEVKYPYEEKYEIRGDTLYVYSDGKISYYPLEEDAISLLNFNFLWDSTRFYTKIHGDVIELRPKQDAWFNSAKLFISKDLPRAIEVEDDEKIIKFTFRNWKFYDRKTGE